MTLPAMPTNPVGREYLRVAGGYGSPPEGTSPAGGLDVDNAGNLATNGDATIAGNLAVLGEVAGPLTLGGALQRGANGIDKTWFTDLLPGAHIIPGSAGAVTLYDVNAHQKLVAIPFGYAAQENAGVQFALPPDYDGSLLNVQFLWTSPDASLSGDAHWKLYGPTTAAADGDSLDVFAEGETVLLSQSLDTYQGQWALHAGASTLTLPSPTGGLIVGTVVRSVATNPFTGDALLLGMRIQYA